MGGTTTRSAKLIILDEANWQEVPPGTVFRCCVFVRAAIGGVVAAAAQLPGIEVAAADTDAALARIRISLADALRAYKAAGQIVPWTELSETPEFSMLKVLMVEL